DKERYPLTGMIVGSIIAGFVLNFIFVNYRVSVRQSVADSMKNVINALLGIVNVFADVMSYIRLWAVGLAGGAIS
ncbi:V-type ATP synthase subunit I, partial [Treponema pallidum]